MINCKHRHIVFTIPFELHFIFRKNRKLLNILFKSASQTILDWFYSLNKSQNFKPGISRPAMAQSRIIDYDASFVAFWYQRHEDNKKIIEKIPVFEFIQRLIVHILDEQFKMLRYYGIYAHKCKHHDKLIKRVKQSSINIRKKLSKWRESIELSFGYDPIKCSCGNFMSFFNIYCKNDIAYSSA